MLLLTGTVYGCNPAGHVQTPCCSPTQHNMTAAYTAFPLCAASQARQRGAEAHRRMRVGHMHGPHARPAPFCAGHSNAREFSTHRAPIPLAPWIGGREGNTLKLLNQRIKECRGEREIKCSWCFQYLLRVLFDRLCAPGRRGVSKACALTSCVCFVHKFMEKMATEWQDTF